MYALATNVAIEDLGRGDVLNKADESVKTNSFGCSHCHRSLDDSPPQSTYILEIVKDFTQCIRLTPLDRLQPRLTSRWASSTTSATHGLRRDLLQECLKGNDRKCSTIFIEIVNFIRARKPRVLNVQARVLSPEAALAE